MWDGAPGCRLVDVTTAQRLGGGQARVSKRVFFLIKACALFFFLFCFCRSNTLAQFVDYHLESMSFGGGGAASAAYGSSQARGQIGPPAARLHHSHSDAGSEPHF